MNSRRRLLSLLAISFALSSVLASAAPPPSAVPTSDKHQHESSYALVVATVFGSGNQAVYGIKVQIRRAGDRKLLFEELSNHSGEVAFRVPAGKQDYTLTADVKHSKQKTKPQATAHVENDERVEVSIHLTE